MALEDRQVLRRPDEPGLYVQHITDLCPVDARDDGLTDVPLLQRRVSLRTLLEFEVLPPVPGASLHLEARVFVEVDDLDLGRRLDDFFLSTLERLELRGTREILDDDPIDLQPRGPLKAGFLSIVSCVPFCQLPNLKAPLEMSIELDQSC